MKRILSLLLVFVMLLTTLVFSLASCGEEETKKPSGSRPSSTPAGEGDIFAERAAIDDGLGEYDFGGRKLRIVSDNPPEYFVKEEDRNQGKLIVDAKYNRNKTVEDRFNFEIETAYTARYDDVSAWVSKTVLSGSDEFDLFCSHSASAGALVLKNVFLNWYDIPNVDFTKPWWSYSCADELTYDGKCILAVSDFNYSAISGAYCILFNKNFANSYDLGNLYEVVMNGDWTYEYFHSLVKDVYVDSDGDGDKTQGDFYGYEQDHWFGCPISSWLWAFDNPICEKDADGVPVIAVKTDKINNIVNSIYDLCHNTNGCFYEGNNDKSPNTLFYAKKAIFTMATLGTPTGESLRNFEDEYGLLPLPKWDENQDRYYTMASGAHSVLAVPKTMKDTEFVGTCIEALSAESYKQVVPTFYEIALKTRYLRDNESKEVLDLLIEGRTFDFGYIYGAFETFGFMLSDMMSKANNNFESYYKRNFTGARYHIKTITRVFDKLG